MDTVERKEIGYAGFEAEEKLRALLFEKLRASDPDGLFSVRDGGLR